MKFKKTFGLSLLSLLSLASLLFLDNHTTVQATENDNFQLTDSYEQSRLATVQATPAPYKVWYSRAFKDGSLPPVTRNVEIRRYNQLYKGYLTRTNRTWGGVLV